VIDGALVAWFALTAISVAYVAYDAFRNNPELTVMRWGWLLVTAYTGPLGASLYVLSCKEPGPNAHEQFIRPLWKQTLGSTIHCLAGDATGIIVAATLTLAIGYAMWVDLVAEYVFGFLFGLLIFQALFMRDMLGGSYLVAVRRSLIPEWLSMNAVMAGMVPVMVTLMSRDMRAMEPSSLRYWGAMSLATTVGFAVAFPVNAWLVAVGLKHGMGTVRALGRGGHGLAAERGRIEAAAAHPPPDALPARAAQPGPSDGAGSVPAVGRAARPSAPAAVAVPPSVTRPQLVAVMMLTVLSLGAGLLVSALAGDLAMRPGADHRMPADGAAARDTTEARMSHGRQGTPR
jgi:hypothetical protein